MWPERDLEVETTGSVVSHHKRHEQNGFASIEKVACPVCRALTNSSCMPDSNFQANTNPT